MSKSAFPVIAAGAFWVLAAAPASYAQEAQVKSQIEQLRAQVKELEQRIDQLQSLDQKVKVIDRRLQVQQKDLQAQFRELPQIVPSSQGIELCHRRSADVLQLLEERDRIGDASKIIAAGVLLLRPIRIAHGLRRRYPNPQPS